MWTIKSRLAPLKPHPLLCPGKRELEDRTLLLSKTVCDFVLFDALMELKFGDLTWLDIYVARYLEARRPVAEALSRPPESR